jgi:hypothetical protein
MFLSHSTKGFLGVIMKVFQLGGAWYAQITFNDGETETIKLTRDYTIEVV